MEPLAENNAGPPAGWYANPTDSLSERYWHGQGWATETRPKLPAAPAEQLAVPAQGFAVGTQPWAPVATNGLAVASLVLGIIWIYWIGSILALVFGYIAMKQIDQSGGRQGGRGLAKAGVILGWVGVGILGLLMVVGLLAAASGA